MEIKVGAPPPGAFRYKRAVDKLFCAHGASVTTRATLLALCLNGDWRAKKVEHFVNAGTAPELAHPAAILDHLTNGLVVALAATQPNL